MSFQEDQPIYLAVKGVVFDVTSGKGKLALWGVTPPPPPFPFPSAKIQQQKSLCLMIYR